ncbi:MAG: HD domain-containing protein [Spirochaetales bacterium]|nr:HD domain-containing protein [Spirochaetales bacterium]
MYTDRRIKRSLKPKTSLSYRLTAYFVIFGLIIGYTVFVFSTAYNGWHILNDMTGIVSNEIRINEELLGEFNEAHFRKMLTNVLVKINDQNIPLKGVGAFIETNDGWTKYTYVDNVIRSEPFYISDNKLFNKALEKGAAFSNIPFFGKADSTSVYFLIPLANGPRIVASAVIKREGLDSMVRSRKEELMGFGIILIVFSFLLGKIFSSRITRPITKLAANAFRISEGEDDRTLVLKRSDEIGVLSRALGKMRGDLNERLKAMEIMNKIDKVVLSSISRNDLLNRVIGFVCDYIDQSTVVMALRDETGGGFELISAVRQSEPAIMIDNPYIPDELLSNDTKGLFRIPGVFSEERNLNEVLIKQLNLPEKTRRFYNVPLYLKESYLGSLLIIRADQQNFTEEQQQTLRKLGDQVGVALQSVMAVEEMNSLQIGSIRALSRAIDAKSKWTAGHSERVAELSEQLGNAAGLGEQEIRRLVISALLHDIGKIGVSENILDKPAKLTKEEFDLIKQHPDMGHKIIANLPNYEDISDGIRYHHERWNGAGYPMALKGDDIPLFGRIIAIADVFDALSADRPYRDGMCVDDCIQFIFDKKGIDFDEVLAKKFIELMKSSKNHLHNSDGSIKV